MPLLCEPNDAVRAVAVAKRREYNIAFCYAFYTLHCITTLHCTTLHCIALDYITLHCMHACIHTYVIIHRYRRFKRFEVKSMCTCRRDMQCCILACGTVVTAHAFEQPTKQSSEVNMSHVQSDIVFLCAICGMLHHIITYYY